MRRTFSTDLLKTWGLPYDAYNPLEAYNPADNLAIVYRDDHVDSSRWSEHHELIFRAPDDHKLWAVWYSRGLTEMQDEKPWEYEETSIGLEVEPYEVTKVDYRVVPDLDEDHDHELV